MANIRPEDLPAASTVSNTDAFVVDRGSAVQKATPSQIVDAAIPLASQAEAEAGTNNAKRVTPLRVKQAIDAIGVSADSLAAGLATKADATATTAALATKVATADLASTDSGKGAALVGFKQSGAGSVSRLASSKLGDIIHVKDKGAIGDNSTNDTTALQNVLAIAEGKTVVFDEGTYLYDPTGSGLTFPANCTVIMNGAILKETAPVDAARVTVEEGATIDSLVIQSAGGSASRGVRIIGSNVKIGEIRVTAPPATGSGNIRRRAISIGTEGGARISNVEIGSVYVENWDRGLQVHEVDNLTIGSWNHTGYVNSIWFSNCRNVRINGGWVKGTSANATGAPGENGVLIEAVAHYGTTGVHILNMTVEDSGEHAFRVGGQFVIKGAWFIGCKAIMPGIADGTGIEPDDHGGCGFKCLGPTLLAGSHHEDINFIGCVVEDVKYSTDQSNNFAGFNIGKTIGFTLVNPVVRLSRDAYTGDPYTPPTFSCYNGIEIIGSSQGTITNPLIDKPFNDAIYFYDAADGGGITWGNDLSYITVLGGRAMNPGRNGITVEAINRTVRRIDIQGSFVVEGGEKALVVSSSGTATFINCSANMRVLGQTVATTTGTDAWMLTFNGNFSGAVPCLNGSTFQSMSAGSLAIRKAGAWTVL